MISDLVVELKGFDAEEESKGLFGFFKKSANRLEGLKANMIRPKSMWIRSAALWKSIRYS